MQTYIMAFAASLAISVISAIILIPLLRRLKFGQQILEIGPKWHMNKQGTPTMGGLIFITGTTIATVVIGWPQIIDGYYGHLVVLTFALIFGLIGFVDDFCKVVKKQNQGLTAMQKLFLQLAVSAAFIALLRNIGLMTTEVYIPFLQITFDLPWVLFAVNALLVVAGMVNAVNLTDGVDGLCTGVTLPIVCFFGVLSLLWDKGELGVFISALAGGLLGFLFFNFHPAKVFMGDTGSLFLGGAVCGLGFAFDAPILIIITGAVYILEMMSVILQVLFFKLSHGKRLFKMAPLHHHFEMTGWSEKKLFGVFTAVTIVLCAAAYFGAIGR